MCSYIHTRCIYRCTSLPMQMALRLYKNSSLKEIAKIFNQGVLQHFQHFNIYFDRRETSEYYTEVSFKFLVEKSQYIGTKNALTVNRTQGLKIFSLALSQLSYQGTTTLPKYPRRGSNPRPWVY